MVPPAANGKKPKIKELAPVMQMPAPTAAATVIKAAKPVASHSTLAKPAPVPKTQTPAAPPKPKEEPRRGFLERALYG